MKLSEFDINVIRDNEFELTGYVDSCIERTLAYCDNPVYLKKADENNNISCIITTENLANQIRHTPGIGVSTSPRISFYQIHNQLIEKHKHVKNEVYGIGENCIIHPSAIISEMSNIGNNVTINENVIIKDQVFIGDNTFIDAGVIIGCEALLYYKSDQRVIHVKHDGGVCIGENVTILSNAIIARSVHRSFLTSIGDNSIVGITTNVGHEAVIDNNCVISSNCVIARRAKICEGAWVGPSSVIREHVTIGKDAQVKLGSIVIKDVADKQMVSGNFAIEHIANLRKAVEK